MTQAKNRATWLIRDEHIGVKCLWNLGCAFRQVTMLGLLWVLQLSQTRCTLR